MAFGGFESGSSQQPMAEINMTPFVDVILVLLIIFIVTTPLMTQSISVNLPQTEGSATQEKPEAVSLSIGAQGQISLNKAAIADAELEKKLKELAEKQPQPELRLLADKDVRYARVAQIMAMVREAGINKMGFVMLASAGSLTADKTNSP